MQELDNSAIAGLLEEIGSRLELTGDSPFKVRAYFAAAESIRGAEEPVARLIESRRLQELPGIGGAITEKVMALHRQGTHPLLERLRREVPDHLLDLTRIPGLGAKRVLQLRAALGIEDLAALDAALKAGQVAKVKGFGEKLQAKLRDSVAFVRQTAAQYLLPQADVLLQVACADLRAVPGVEEVAVAGEARRRCELVAGPCVVAAARDPQEVQARVGAAGVRVTVVPRAQFAAALLYATGAPAHIAQLEQRAAAAGIKFSREGLARDDKMLPAPSEKDIYAALGLPFIEPEWREGRDEIEAAAAGRLPAPLKVSDLLGILHCHTRYSDGSNTVEEMAEAVREMGFRYLGVADHSKSAFYAGGLDESEIRAQHEEIERLNTRYAREGFRIFKGIESDILADGALDYSDEVLASFDFIVASIHSHFELDEEKQTARIEKALAHPAATILGHPTGRLLRRRAGHPVNLDRVLQACAKHGVAVELNAHPERLDLDWRWHARVLELGLKVSISPDAHSLPELAHIRYGVDIARKGRLPAGSILNALDAERLAEFFRRRS